MNEFIDSDFNVLTVRADLIEAYRLSTSSARRGEFFEPQHIVLGSPTL